jgi:L-lactate dehydrogenase complex protein LldG
MHEAETHPADLLERVLGKTGASMQRVRGPREAVAAIARIAHRQGVREVLYAPDELIERDNIKLLLAAHGIELVAVSSAGEKARHLRVALTGAELAIAETGTLLLGGQPGGWGLASVLPWVHVVLLPSAAIVADLNTAFEIFAARLRDGEGDWVWITGPSRTADIGHVLVLGAHGPNALEVLVIE